MGFLSTVKGWFNTIFNKRISEVFGVEVVDSSDMATFVNACLRIYRGHPDWVKEEKNIKTINFAKSLCSETARLATMGIGVNISGSARADWLLEQFLKATNGGELRRKLEKGLAQGTMILKPNGEGVDFIPFDRFRITKTEDQKIRGAVFISSVFFEGRWYTRFEYHHFEGDLYIIDNRCFVGDREGEATKEVQLVDSPWSELRDHVEITGVDRMLFGVFVTPAANNVDLDSYCGLPIFADAIEELRDLDIAYSRNALEINESEKIILLDSDRLVPGGTRVTQTAESFKMQREKMELPHYVKSVYGSGDPGGFYQEINPALNTETRLKGIDALLSQIGYKAGYSNGYFVFNERTGIVTATQIESDQQRTIQLIKDIRENLEDCIGDLIYALDKFADLYDLAPLGEYEIAYDFMDITYNVEEDKARWYSYVIAGRIPFWYYLMRFEGFTEDDAKALAAEAQPSTNDLAFSEE